MLLTIEPESNGHLVKMQLTQVEFTAMQQLYSYACSNLNGSPFTDEQKDAMRKMANTFNKIELQ